MTRPADSALPSETGASCHTGASTAREKTGQLLAAIGFGSLALITLVHPGATRMYAWPWSLAYAIALLAPALQLLVRCFDRRRPLALPSAGWSGLWLATVAIILASALASPYRASALGWSSPLLAGFAMFLVVFDELHAAADPAALAKRRERWLTLTGFFGAAIALVSMGQWLALVAGQPLRSVFVARNAYPLGHSNYTAGLALLLLPVFSALMLRARGVKRAAWCFAALLALGMLFTSGSRGGFLGLIVLAALQARAVTRALRLKLWVVLVGAGLVLGTLLFLNPRTRAGLTSDELSASNVQRAAMLTAGFRMGADRPLLGWGPGTTPLVYPRYRAGLAGGTENVLQLHSMPVQLWAELGGIATLLAVLAVAFAVRAAWTSPAYAAVALALGGYVAFSFTDWQLDVPVFAYALAIGAALLATPAPLFTPEPKIYPLLRVGARTIAVRWRGELPTQRRAVGLITLLALLCVALLGHRDPTPALNIRALALGTTPAKADEAIALLRQSLALNPQQEIAHFNLGWLLVVRDPIAAESHFLAAAQLVPDKGGVYFGLGLARLNQGRHDEAARAFAFEGFNDPAFIVSPWWRTAEIRETRTNTLAHLVQLQSLALAALPPEGPLAREVRYARELNLWLATGAPVMHPNTPARRAYFAARPAPPAFEKSAVVAYRRERTGYPVLTRDPDLPAPADLFDVQENSLATGELAFLFPAKGWLASPLLPALFAETDSRPK